MEVEVTDVNYSVGEGNGDKDGADIASNVAEYVADSDEEVHSDSDGDEPDVPDDYIFQSYFAFIAWGPFAPINERLEILMTTDDKKKNKAINATQKKRA